MRHQDVVPLGIVFYTCILYPLIASLAFDCLFNTLFSILAAWMVPKTDSGLECHFSRAPLANLCLFFAAIKIASMLLNFT